MYKQLFFLHKSDDEKALIHFKEFIIKHLSDIAGKEIKLARVESNLLLDVKYSHFCELVFESREVMDEIMNSKPGRKLNEALRDFHKLITVISVNYND
jgi:hypothetical protein